MENLVLILYIHLLGLSEMSSNIIILLLLLPIIIIIILLLLLGRNEIIGDGGLGQSCQICSAFC